MLSRTRGRTVGLILALLLTLVTGARLAPAQDFSPALPLIHVDNGPNSEAAQKMVAPERRRGWEL